MFPLLAAVASRAYSTYLLAAAARIRHEHLFGPGSITAHWDSGWYLSIAATGYHVAPLRTTALGGQHDYAFFPLWPVAIRIVSFTGLEPTRAAALLSAGLFVVAAVLVAAALAPAFGRAVATDAVLLLAFSPAAYTFSMAYSEALFLVFAALAFIATTPVRRGLAVMLAVFTRVVGVGLVAVDGMRWLVSRGRDWGAFVSAVMGGVAFLVWWAVVAAISGHPAGFLGGSPDWAPVTGYRQVIKVLETLDASRILQLGIWVVALVGALVAFRRSWQLGLFALVSLLLALMPGGYVSSMPRYALAAFPLFAGLALLAGRRGTIALVALSAGGQALLVAIAFTAKHTVAP